MISVQYYECYCTLLRWGATFLGHSVFTQKTCGTYLSQAYSNTLQLNTVNNLFFSVEEIHSVGMINNVETSYFT